MRSARGLCLCLLFPGRILRGLGGLLGGCDGWIRRDIHVWNKSKNAYPFPVGSGGGLRNMEPGIK